ncbi:hypothetical protein [Georgenia sp. SYP-B2076]|uniref:hypothetical protein n=1 Tax=Georgenia sp. SYP-B2076 TaxID=2495881 RepID=UPI000F8F08F4|nr:hypothetical protein [Georgenia sp. SYP-B2076]
MTTGRRAACVAAAVLVLAGCTNAGREPTAPEPGGPSGASAEPGKTTEDVAAAVFGSVADVEPLAEADGVVTDGPRRTPVRVAVETVDASPESTLVTFTLYGTQQEEEPLPLDAFNSTRMLMMDVRDVSIVDQDAQVRYAPYLGYEEGETLADAGFCMCSTAPKTVNLDGITLYATYPPLAESSRSITLDIPGFDPIEGLPVSRS